MDFGWTLHRLERLSVHVSYLQSINHDSNLRPYLLGLFLTKLRNRLSDPLRPPDSYSVHISIEHGHPLSENTLIESLNMMIHCSYSHISSMPVYNFAPSRPLRSLLYLPLRPSILCNVPFRFVFLCGYNVDNFLHYVLRPLSTRGGRI